MGTILITGGAGYIGSHIVRALRERGRDHVVLDNLSEGHASSVAGSTLEHGDLADRETLAAVLRKHRVEWIVHMAANCLVGESMSAPEKYWKNNVLAGLVLLEEARRAGVRGMVFSSSAAVYGEPPEVPIDEDSPHIPTNWYGETKLVFERALTSYHSAYGLASISLRYFNAGGAAEDGSLGEDHQIETHLIPLVIGAALGVRPPVTVLGADYATPDGTCVRDYVHVDDLADAHLLALEALEAGRIRHDAINLGGGEGKSVREVLDVTSRIVGRPIPTVEGPRRPGDPGVLVASSRAAGEKLGWRPTRSDLPRIIETAWRWHRSHPEGFESTVR